MKIEYNVNTSETVVVIPDQCSYQSSEQPMTAADLVVALVWLIQKHGDLPVHAYDDSYIDAAWYRPAGFAGEAPICFVVS
jgi:hypothetical protein